MSGDITHQEAVEYGDGVAARGPAAEEALLGRLPALVACGLGPQPRAASLGALLLRLLGRQCNDIEYISILYDI